ncbi:MAG: hypothetical protein J6S14_09815 [Clostridia bacterium]|nr:hypothetical protein [Clostridia bacterium]
MEKNYRIGYLHDGKLHITEKIISQEPIVEIIIRFNDGRQAICSRAFKNEEDFLMYAIREHEFQYIKAYEVFYDGVRSHSWVMKRG